MLAALLPAGTASAEPTATADAPSLVANVGATAEDAAPVEIPPAPVEQPETAGATAETSGGDIPAVTAVAEKVTNAATEVVDKATPSTIVRVPVDSPPPVQPDNLVGSSVEKLRKNVPQHRVTAVVEEVGRNAAKTIATTTKRLMVPVAELDVPSSLLDSISPLSAPPLMAEEAQPVGLLPRSPAATGLRLPVGGLPADASIVRIANVPGSMPTNWEMDISPREATAETTFAGSSDERSGRPALPDLPPPAQSPTTVGGPGGSIFVPAVALLALLALAAPAARRRLGEAAAFRPPTPFVCALERPG